MQEEDVYSNWERHPKASFAVFTACESWLRAIPHCVSRAGAFAALSEYQKGLVVEPFAGAHCSTLWCVGYVFTQRNCRLSKVGIMVFP